MAVVLASIGYLPFRKRTVEVTPENIEDNLKIWADHLAVGLVRQNPGQDEIFSYISRASGGDPIEISIAKEKPGYLQFKSTLNLSSVHMAIVAKMSKRDFVRFLGNVGLELSRLSGITTGISWNPDQQGRPTQVSMLIESACPISNLNEGLFAERFDREGSAIAQVRAYINATLETLPVSVPTAALPH